MDEHNSIDQQAKDDEVTVARRAIKIATTTQSKEAEKPEAKEVQEVEQPGETEEPEASESEEADEAAWSQQRVAIEPEGAEEPAQGDEDDGLPVLTEHVERGLPVSTQPEIVDDIQNVPTRVLIMERGIAYAGTALTPEELAALRRMRVNRLLMRKRRHERDGRSIATILLTIVVVLFFLVTSLFSGSIGAAYAYYRAQVPLVNGIAQHSLFQTTHIYDRNGNLLYELYDKQIGYGRRTYVNYNDISPLLVNATIAAEDHTFWTNNGVDFAGIARAAISNFQSRGVVEGGSTVTQQLIKKQFFDGQQRTLQIKGEEAILATGLTQQYPKWKIMEMYLNTVYYGDLNYGAEAAAESYFRIQPKCDQRKCVPALKQLDLAQASLLAGLPQSPSYYNPTINKASALQRQQVVLQAMVQLGMVTPQQAKDAQNEIKNFTFKTYSDTHKIQAPHFVSYVIDNVLVPLLGAQNLRDSGYNIYTTLDLNLEKKIESRVYSLLYQPQQDSYLGYYGPVNATNNLNNAAVVVMDPRTGEVLAMDGSANYNQKTAEMQGQYNAALALRQPGSSFKPIVYATAFEMGWYPAMIVPDHKTVYPVCDYNVPTKCYTPQNYDSTFHTGYPMTIRTAVANSYNIPAIDAIEFAGIPNVLNMAGRLGLTEVANKSAATLGPSMAIGAVEVTPLDMTDAYATFANQGVRIPPVSVLEITNNQGQPIYKYDPTRPHGIRAMGADVAYLIDSILSDKAARYHEFFPGNPLELDRPAAAKTGTTDSFRDNWTMGYTPHIAVGVWAGNSDNEPMTPNTIGITGAGPIWHDVMEMVSRYYNYPADDFVRPNNVHQGTVSAVTGLLARPGEASVTDWFIDGTMPTIQGNNYYVPPCTNGCRRGGGGGGGNGGFPPIGQPILPGPKP